MFSDFSASGSGFQISMDPDPDPRQKSIHKVLKVINKKVCNNYEYQEIENFHKIYGKFL